jgi:hypothetical protein
MIIDKEILVKQNINEAWKTLGQNFAHAYVWASAVKHSEGRGANYNGSACSERGCSTTMGGIKEKLTAFSRENYSLSYEVATGLPKIVKHATNAWQLVAIDTQTCMLHIKMSFEMAGYLGVIFEPILKWQMGKMANELLEDFAYYVENGQPHPRKLKAQQNESLKILKKYLTINSLFSASSGIVMLLFSSMFTDIFQVSNVYVFPIIGINLLIFSIFVWYIASKKLSNKVWVWAITNLDIFWVLGSFAIVLFGWFSLSKIGTIITIGIALWIAYLAYNQFKNNK